MMLRESNEALIDCRKQLSALPPKPTPFERGPMTSSPKTARWEGLNKREYENLMKKVRSKHKSRLQEKFNAGSEHVLKVDQNSRRIKDDKVVDKLKEMMCYFCDSMGHNPSFCPKQAAISQMTKGSEQVHTMFLAVEGLKADKTRLENNKNKVYAKFLKKCKRILD